MAASRYTKKSGERQDFTTWRQVEIRGPGTVDWLGSRPLLKSSKVYVEGEIRNERYTGKDDQEHFFTKVAVAGPGHELKSIDRPQADPADEAGLIDRPPHRLDLRGGSISRLGVTHS